MPRAGGVYSAPPGTAGTPNTTIESSKYNALVADLVDDANNARPIPAGGIGSNTAVGGIDNLNAAGASMASAATVNLANATGVAVTITGTVPILSFGTVGAGAERVLTFAAALTLTYNATSLILPGAADIVTAAGDMMTLRSLGGGNWRCADYQRAAVPPYSSSATETLKNKSLEDATTAFVDDADPTKKLKFQVGGLTTATTRTVTMPDADGQMLLSTKQQLVAGFRNLKVSVPNDTQVTITADALTVEDAAGNAVRLTAVNVTATITTAGANGLDTGSEAANIFYHGWVAWNGTTSIGLLSASPTAPTLPGGYTHKTYVTAVRNDASANFWRMLQFGNRAQVVVGANPTAPPTIFPGGGAYIAYSLAAFVPSTASVLHATARHTMSDNSFFIVGPNASYNNTTGIAVDNNSGITGSSININASFSVVLETLNLYCGGGGNGLVYLNGWELNI